MFATGGASGIPWRTTTTAVRNACRASGHEEQRPLEFGRVGGEPALDQEQAVRLHGLIHQGELDQARRRIRGGTTRARTGGLRAGDPTSGRWAASEFEVSAAATMFVVSHAADCSSSSQVVDVPKGRRNNMSARAQPRTVLEDHAISWPVQAAGKVHQCRR